MTGKKPTTREVAKYLQRLGVEVDVDFERERVYVVALTAPIEVELPKREGEFYLFPGDRVKL